MKVSDLLVNKEFKCLNPQVGIDGVIKSGYVGDLLSWVMANAGNGCAWVTIQTHVNIIAVATLLEMTCVIIPEGAEVEERPWSRPSSKISRSSLPASTPTKSVKSSVTPASEMEQVAVDSHIHSGSIALWRARNDPNNIVNMAIIKELPDFIAVTDHNSGCNLPAVMAVAKELGLRNGHRAVYSARHRGDHQRRSSYSGLSADPRSRPGTGCPYLSAFTGSDERKSNCSGRNI